MFERVKFYISHRKTEFKYLVWVHLQRSYPKNIDAAQAIFIHIPKTAGTSLYNLIGYTGIGHVNYRWYESRSREKFNRYFKFAFVRNPWDRLVSAFFYLKKGGSNTMDKHWATQNISGYSDFDSFVRNWLSVSNVQKYFHFIPQHKFICDDSLNVKMDYVGRFENLNEDFDLISQKLNLNHTLPYINRSRRHAYQGYYSAETKAIVAQVYQTDVELFGYEFE